MNNKRQSELRNENSICLFPLFDRLIRIIAGLICRSSKLFESTLKLFHLDSLLSVSK